MSTPKSCPFCGDRHPEMVSGPCKFTQDGLSQAQIHCTHCAARGTRFCGEDTLALAEMKATMAWDDATPESPGHLSRLVDTGLTNATLSLFALALSYGLYDGVHGSAIAGFLTGSLALALTAALMLRRRRDVRHRADLEALERAAAGSESMSIFPVHGETT